MKLAALNPEPWQVGVAPQEGPSVSPLFKLETVALPNQVAARTEGFPQGVTVLHASFRKVGVPYFGVLIIISDPTIKGTILGSYFRKPSE